MIYITGGLYGVQGFKNRFFTYNEDKEYFGFSEIGHLTRNDFLIFLGNFGIPTRSMNKLSREEMEVIHWLNNQPFTTLFIDGGMENLDVIFSLPDIDFGGSKAKMVSDKILYLQRGHIYSIEEQQFFAFGGGFSSFGGCFLNEENLLSGLNQQYSKGFLDLPTADEIKNAYERLGRDETDIDFVLTHVPPLRIVPHLCQNNFLGFKNYEKELSFKVNTVPSVSSDFFYEDILEDFLKEYFEHFPFKEWFFGYFPFDITINTAFGSFSCLYHEILAIDNSEEEQNSSLML